MTPTPFRALTGNKSVPKSAAKRLPKADADAPATPDAGAEGEAAPPRPPALPALRLEDLALGRTLGTGSFGRVRLARVLATGEVLAVKSLPKAAVLAAGALRQLRAERAALAALDHPFAVRLRGACQDAAAVHLALEFAPGGELFTRLRAAGRFPEHVARFYAGEAALVLGHLHDALGLVYRDLKPENLLLDALGHLVLVDFGFAKALPPGRKTYTLCGTPDYMAPEVILATGHGRGADWWGLGVLVFEMLAGYPPFAAADAQATYARACAGAVAVPAHFSPAARDLVRRLLAVDPARRLGCGAGGARDVRGHAFFRGLDWGKLEARRLPPPITPALAAPDDASNFECDGGGGGGGAGPEPPPLSAAEQALFADF